MSDQTDAAGTGPASRARPVDPRLLRYAAASRPFFVLIALITVAHTAAIIAFAWLLTRAITGAIDGMPAAEIAATLGWLAGVVAVRAVLVWGRDAVSARAAARVQTQLRDAVVGAVGALGPGWLSGRNSAALAVTAGRGLDALEAYFGRYLPQLVMTVIATPIILAVMWWQDWISGLTVLITLPLIPLFMVLIGLATRTVQKRQWQTLHRLATRFADTVQGLSTLKVFGRQHRAAASIESVTETYRRETMRVLRVSFLSGFALEIIASLSVAVVAVSIGFRLLDGSIALSVGLFVLLLAPEAYLPLRQVGVQFHAAAEGVAATDDVFDVLDAARAMPVRRRRVAGAETAGHPGRSGSVARGEGESGAVGSVVLRRMRAVRGAAALAAVDLEALPGTVTLIEGPSGAGKSSVLAVLRGACDYEGSATVDGVEVSELAPTWLAWAGQSPGLIAGTVHDNVTLGDDDPDPRLVARALDAACADVPASLTLGVQGAGLSGGQAQRVAVARAMYRVLRGRAHVLALDEPSSALDAATEARLWASVRAMADGGTIVLLVSHRTTAREIADRIVALPAREVVA